MGFFRIYQIICDRCYASEQVKAHRGVDRHVAGVFFRDSGWKIAKDGRALCNNCHRHGDPPGPA